MASLNKVTLIGNLGSDPETKTLKSGDTLTTISIATTEKWKDKTSGESREKTEWHRISFFGKLADIVAKFLKKGSLIYVEGSLHTEKYTDKDGVEKYSTNIKGSNMVMLDKKAGSDSKTSASSNSDNDDIAF